VITIDESKLMMVGDGLKVADQDGKLILVVDKSNDIGPSSSGKMTGIASTGGFATIPGGLKVNVYIGKKI
jgi:hypothetical protein